MVGDSTGARCHTHTTLAHTRAIGRRCPWSPVVSIAPVLVGKQAANQARASNPRSPPGSTGSATDTDTHSRSPLRGGLVEWRRRERVREEEDEDEEEPKESGFWWRWAEGEGKEEEEEEGCRGSGRSMASVSVVVHVVEKAVWGQCGTCSVCVSPGALLWICHAALWWFIYFIPPLKPTRSYETFLGDLFSIWPNWTRYISSWLAFLHVCEGNWVELDEIHFPLCPTLSQSDWVGSPHSTKQRYIISRAAFA